MIGQQIQNYIIISKLGQGGMGTVYKAVDNVLGREVALKMLNTLMINQPQVLERFKKEAQVLARLLHPNIAVIYNLIEQEQQHFMVMEYVEGENLDEILRQYKTIPYQMVVLIFIQALEGLHHAHRKGIFHRDIKPSNLILTPDGTVKLMDFGIAKVAGEQRLTQVNKVIGTIEFLAPEIIEGKEPSVASDIYAAAVTMYELLSGKLPFESGTDFNLMQEILKKKPLPLERLNSDVPRVLSNIVMKALEKKPENRYADAGAFKHALTDAFPDLRIADLYAYIKQLETKNTAALTQVFDQPVTSFSNANMQATRVESITRPGNIIKNIHHKYLSSKRAKILAGLVMFLIVFLAGFAIFSKKDEPDHVIAGESMSKENVSENKETINTGNSTINENNISPPVSGDNTHLPVTTPSDPKYPANDQDKNDKAKREQEKADQEKKERVRREKENAEREKRDQLKKDQENAPPPVVEIKKTPKTIEIRGRVPVKIRMTDNVKSVENLSEGQSLHFIVTEPVEYENETIIKRGASVNATIKGIGHVLIEVTINSIENASGKRINLDRISVRKGKKDFPEGDVYTITLGRGVVVNL